MSRSRRTKSRSSSQRAISLLASTLPGPVQRIAETTIGSTLLIFGIPILIVAGVLQLDWTGGIPHLSVDRDRAAQLKNAARGELQRIAPNQIQEWEDSASKLWHASQSGSQPEGNAFTGLPRNAFPPTHQQQLFQYPQQQQSYQQQPTFQQPPPYYQPNYQQQPVPYYQPQQYQSYQPPQNGRWLQ